MQLDQTELVRVTGTALISLIWVMEILLLIRALLSWIPESGANRFGALINQVTEPILIPFRRLVSRSSVLGNSMIDISFIVCILVLEVLKSVIARAFNLGYM